MNNKIRSATRLGLVAACLVSLSACSNMNNTDQRVLSGAAIGAAAGAGTFWATGGCVSCGAVVGTAAGAVGGYVVDQMNK